jgi:hypothetical protein
MRRHSLRGLLTRTSLSPHSAALATTPGPTRPVLGRDPDPAAESRIDDGADLPLNVPLTGATFNPEYPTELRAAEGVEAPRALVAVNFIPAGTWLRSWKIADGSLQRFSLTSERPSADWLELRLLDFRHENPASSGDDSSDEPTLIPCVDDVLLKVGAQGVAFKPLLGPRAEWAAHVVVPEEEEILSNPFTFLGARQWLTRFLNGTIKSTDHRSLRGADAPPTVPLGTLPVTRERSDSTPTTSSSGKLPKDEDAPGADSLEFNEENMLLLAPTAGRPSCYASQYVYKLSPPGLARHFEAAVGLAGESRSSGSASSSSDDDGKSSGGSSVVLESFPCANYYLCVGRDPKEHGTQPGGSCDTLGRRVHPGEEPAKRVELWTTRDVEPGEELTVSWPENFSACAWYDQLLWLRRGAASVGAVTKELEEGKQAAETLAGPGPGTGPDATADATTTTTTTGGALAEDPGFAESRLADACKFSALAGLRGGANDVAAAEES